MKLIIISIFIIGIIFIIVGYIEQTRQCPLPKIQYRYIPRSFYEEQISPQDLRKTYSDMFDQASTWSTYPFNSKNDQYNNLNYANLEYDYKYCIFRSPEKHIAAAGACDCHLTFYG